MKKTKTKEATETKKRSGSLGRKREADPYFDGEKLYAIGGGRYIQYNGEGQLPDDIVQFMERTGRKPPFMLLPETPVDFFLSKGFGGSSKVHWTGEGRLPEAVFSYLNDHGTLPRTREILDDDDDLDAERDAVEDDEELAAEEDDEDDEE